VYERILYEVDDGIATVTLHRPDKLNAYTPEMGEEIVDAFARAREDDAARVVILTGAGRGFCAGVDLDYMKAAAAGNAPAAFM
jgi:enoyl-CoA hydratase/carnithine racemase